MSFKIVILKTQKEETAYPSLPVAYHGVLPNSSHVSFLYSVLQAASLKQNIMLRNFHEESVGTSLESQYHQLMPSLYFLYEQNTTKMSRDPFFCFCSYIPLTIAEKHTETDECNDSTTKQLFLSFKKKH
jgi:hypothetical protein